MVKNLPAMWETWVQSLSWVNLLEEGMATHSSFLAWISPRTEKAGGYSPRRLKESGMTEQLSTVKNTCALTDGQEAYDKMFNVAKN